MAVVGSCARSPFEVIEMAHVAFQVLHFGEHFPGRAGGYASVRLGVMKIIGGNVIRALAVWEIGMSLRFLSRKEAPISLQVLKLS